MPCDLENQIGVEGCKRGSGEREMLHLNRALESPHTSPHLWVHSGRNVFIFIWGSYPLAEAGTIVWVNTVSKDSK